MATQYNEMAAKAAEIREKMSVQLTEANNYRQMTEVLTAGILQAVEEKINDSSAKTAEILHVKERIQSSIPLIADETQIMQAVERPASTKLVRRMPRII